jgi:hypothetical protein
MPKLHDMRELAWLRVLRKAVERDGLKKVAQQLGRSKGAISGVLSNKYGANTKRIEERVRGALMDKRIECPVLGEIPPGECQDWQEKPFAATNPERVQVYRACRAGCRHFRRT